tara:strand:+ start:68 stop:562 length:495 start_codon:yes stop_codon:yes gene_type:complete
MSWIKTLEDFDTKNYKPNIQQWNYFLKNRFNIHIDLKANRLNKGYFKIIRDYDSARTEENMNGNRNFSGNNYMVLFPQYGLRINCTKDFIENIPLLANVFSEKWEEKPYISHYYDKKLKKVFQGPKIYISTLNLDMYMYQYDHQNDEGKKNILESVLSISRDFY